MHGCRMDSIVENQTNLKTLTEGIHSKEALELVKEHVKGVMGPASMAYSNTMIKMAKLQVRKTRQERRGGGTGEKIYFWLKYNEKPGIRLPKKKGAQ